MQPRYITQNGTGSSAWQLVNPHVTPFNLGIGVIATQPVNYTVQHTYDDPNVVAGEGVYINPNGTATAFNHTMLVNQTTTLDGAYIYPINAVRITKNSGTGSAIMIILQAGIAGP